ncbi:uncharacterized protein LOC135468961 [Liolophura sinensis]|uniref:uncharacterized protein LOC135468961 n=1 Tax=Liolophura sinensis TaxID=3198878 RepID=UPI003158D3D0
MRPVEDKFDVKRLWSFRAKDRFNTLVVDTIFRYPGLSVILGGEDGIIRIHAQPPTGIHDKQPQKPKGTLETKSGPVQNLVVHDVTRFYHKDLIVGDATGRLTVFCDSQILSRQTISSHGINCVQVLQDPIGNVSIVSSDSSGVIAAHLPSAELWRINLNDQHIARDPGLSLSVKCLLAVEVTSHQGQRSSYILASDNARQVQVINQGVVVLTIKTPETITAMCSGTFLPRAKLSLPPDKGDYSEDKPVTQIALGASNGAIYILHDFTLSQDEYANTGLPIMHLSGLSIPDIQSDLLLCAGHFNTLQVFYEGKKSGQYQMVDWVNSLHLVDLDGDGTQEVVLGCLDNSVSALKISAT